MKPPHRTILAALLAALPLTALAQNDTRPPNIIYILADDLGYNELGSYGQQKIKTPNLDRLANEGMRFTQHFYGYLCQRVAHNYYPTHLWRNHDVDVQHNNHYFNAHQKITEPLADAPGHGRAG